MANDVIDGTNWKAYSTRIQDLSKLDFNFDAEVFHNTKDKSGWVIDKYHAFLAKEPPGDPLPKGAFETAQTAIKLYQFPNPNLIRAYFNPDSELVNRNMLLFAKFLGFKFYFGVRIVSVTDEIRTGPDGEKVKVWGYSYRTLKGHFEIGEIRFEISKNFNTGEIFFEINAFSKPDRIPNIFYRIGFKIFGRFLQRSFAKQSIFRLQRLAQAALSRYDLQKNQANSDN